MIFRGFGLIIISGGLDHCGQYVRLRHKHHYKIKLINRTARRANAYLSIDGQSVGVFRVNPRSKIVVDRPQHIDKQFLFLRAGSHSAHNIGAASGVSTNGLVSVQFVPEITPPIYSTCLNSPLSMSKFGTSTSTSTSRGCFSTQSCESATNSA